MRTKLSQTRAGVAWHFFNLGMLTGNYVTCIPSVKSNHELSDGMLGIALFCISLGSMLSLPIAPLWNHKYGTGDCTSGGAMVTALILPILGINGPWPLLILGLLAMGFGMGVIDVSMNTHAIAVEGVAGLTQMGLFHAMYAIGQLFGAMVGGGFAEYGLSVLVNLITLSTLSIAASLWSRHVHTLYTLREELEIAADVARDGEEHADKASRWQRIRGNSTLMSLCTIGFLAYMGEGAIEDWITVFFTESLRAKPLATSLAFAAYSLMVAGGRLMSDRLVQQWGSVRLLQLAGCMSGCGLFLVVLSPRLPASVYVATFALIITGGGLSFTSPVIASAAGRVTGLSAADSISLLTSFTYTGYFVGPPLFGGVAEILGGVGGALCLDALLLLLVAFLAKGVPDITKNYHLAHIV